MLDGSYITLAGIATALVCGSRMEQLFAWDKLDAHGILNIHVGYFTGNEQLGTCIFYVAPHSGASQAITMHQRNNLPSTWTDYRERLCEQ